MTELPQRQEVELTHRFRYWSPWLMIFFLVWIVCYLSIAPAPIELFIKNWPFVFVGFGGAILGNISAVGGGIIFIPAMIFFYHLPPVVALKVAILSQCFGMTSGALGWLQRQKIPWSMFALTLPGLLLGSTISSLVIHPSALLVKVLFGPVSIFLGVLTLRSTFQKKDKVINSFELPRAGKILLVLSSFLGGLITGWIAIGEGEIISALLMIGFSISSTLSIALGVVLLAINSMYLAMIHQFFLDGLPWEIACFTGLGCVFGARVAPFLGQKMKTRTLKYIFSAVAIGDGIIFIVQYLLAQHH